MKPKKNINVLSIDGGGIRGVLPAEILVYVEEKLSEMYGKETKIADHFDYIAGTSTGGILTCLYCIPDKDGNPKYSAKDAANLYFNHGTKIFQKRVRWFLTLGGLITYRYSEKYIEMLFDKYFGDNKIKDSVKPFMVTSIDTDSRDLYLFKSYKAKKDLKHNKFFKIAARATSAAPSYFKPLQMFIESKNGIKELSLLDGGLAINNPAVSAVIEIPNIYKSFENINVLSIGTAPDERSYPYKKAKKWGIISGATKLFNLSLTSTSDATHYQMKELYDDHQVKGKYLRVQPNLYEADSKIDKATKKNIRLLREAGRKSVEDFKEQIDQFLEDTNKH